MVVVCSPENDKAPLLLVFLFEKPPDLRYLNALHDLFWRRMRTIRGERYWTECLIVYLD